MAPVTQFPLRTYTASQKIACKALNGGYVCVSLQGSNAPSQGVGGQILLDKMQALIDNGCTGCGSIPLSEDNNLNTMGTLAVEYVSQSDCVGLCFYSPSGAIEEWSYTASDDRQILGGGTAEPDVPGNKSIASVKYIAPVTLSSGPVPPANTATS